SALTGLTSALSSLPGGFTGILGSLGSSADVSNVLNLLTGNVQLPSLPNLSLPSLTFPNPLLSSLGLNANLAGNIGSNLSGLFSGALSGGLPQLPSLSPSITSDLLGQAIKVLQAAQAFSGQGIDPTINSVLNVANQAQLQSNEVVKQLALALTLKAIQNIGYNIAVNI
ncbi:hypothetical protein A0J61_09533, partial [Choanephora cucurbitarum]